MYNPSFFAARERAQIERLIQDYPFATLITPGDTEPQISHVPLLYRADRGPHGTLFGHVARANPHWQRFAGRASLAVFHGPHTYVSPSWYAEPASAVPTWNYVVAHAYGNVELIVDKAGTLAVLDAMIERFEAARPLPWRLQAEGERLDALLGAIVAFRLTIERIDAKFKLSQNRSGEDRDRVIAALRGEDHADASATAAWMDHYARES